MGIFAEKFKRQPINIPSTERLTEKLHYTRFSDEYNEGDRGGVFTSDSMIVFKKRQCAIITREGEGYIWEDCEYRMAKEWKDLMSRWIQVEEDHVDLCFSDDGIVVWSEPYWGENDLGRALVAIRDKAYEIDSTRIPINIKGCQASVGFVWRNGDFFEVVLCKNLNIRRYGFYIEPTKERLYIGIDKEYGYITLYGTGGERGGICSKKFEAIVESGVRYACELLPALNISKKAFGELEDNELPFYEDGKWKILSAKNGMLDIRDMPDGENIPPIMGVMMESKACMTLGRRENILRVIIKGKKIENKEYEVSLDDITEEEAYLNILYDYVELAGI